MYVSVEHQYWDGGKGPRRLTLSVSVDDLEDTLNDLADSRNKVDVEKLWAALYRGAKKYDRSEEYGLIALADLGGVDHPDLE